MPPVSTRISRFAGPSCKSILYCRPEQPPPTTATRSTPVERPCFASSELTFLAALGVTRMSRSSPVRKVGGAAGGLAVVAIMTQHTIVASPATSTLVRLGSTEVRVLSVVPEEDKKGAGITAAV